MRRQQRDRRVALGFGPGGGALPPSVSSIYPALGLRRGSGLSMTITGGNFNAGASVTIGGIAATGVTVVNSTTITCSTPTLGSDGAFDVVVTNTNSQSGTLAGGYYVIQSALWFKQSQGVTLDGSSKVQSQNDLSGNGFTVSQATAGSRPVVGTAYRNGKDAINFAGGTFLQNTTSNPIAAGSACTLLYAGNGGGRFGAPLSLRLTPNYLAFTLYQAGTNQMYAISDGNGGLVKSDFPDAQSTADFYAIWDVPDRVGADIAFYANGVARTMTVVAALGTENGTTGFQVATDGASQTLSNEQLELVLINRQLTPAERTLWNNYCRTEYNFP